MLGNPFRVLCRFKYERENKAFKGKIGKYLFGFGVGKNLDKK